MMKLDEFLAKIEERALQMIEEARDPRNLKTAARREIMRTKTIVAGVLVELARIAREVF